MKRTKSKVVFLGSAGVGKTSIILRYNGKGFDASITPTLGANFIVSTVEVHRSAVELHIWDTAGQERFRAMVPMYLRNAQVAIIVYDVTQRKSFDELDSWIDMLNNCVSITKRQVVFIANKTDLLKERKVTREEGEQLAGQHSAIYFETSALDGSGIEEAILKIAQLQVEKSIALPNNDKYSTVTVRPLEVEEKRGCC